MGIFQAVKEVEYFVKPFKKLLVNNNISQIEKYACKLEAVGKNAEGSLILSNATHAKLGDASVWIEALLKGQLGEASAEASLIFGDLKSVQRISTRSKGALSIDTKLIRGLKHAEGQKFNNIDDAIKVIEDGIGSRFITKSLDKLTPAQIDKMISELTIDGEKLTKHQEKLLRWYIDGKPLTNKANKDEAFRLFEQFANPLIEKRSAEVVDNLTVGILQQRINEGAITLEELVNKQLFSDNIIDALRKGDILPIKITEINNYRGKYGLPEFSNRQIRQLSRAIGYNNSEISQFKIISDPRGLEYMKYSKEDLETVSSKSVKASGYRTAQLNVVHANGALGEWQFRGEYTNMIGEYEHIAYDLRQGKNTLGPVFNEYKEAISKLSEKEYAQYNEYLEDCYNYYNRLELGLPARKPVIPKGFNKILEEASLKRLHDQNEVIEKELAKNFSPHICYAA